MSEGFYMNSRNPFKYEVPTKPYDDVINKDPFNSWSAFRVPSIIDVPPQQGAVKYGQRYALDGPAGQPIPGQLFGPVILPTVVSIPSPISIQADIEASANLYKSDLQGPEVTKKPDPIEDKVEALKGSGMAQRTRSTWSIPPNQQIGDTVSAPGRLIF